MIEKRLFLALGLLALGGCQDVKPQAPTSAATSPATSNAPAPPAGQSAAFFKPSPNLVTVYFTVSRIHGASALAVGLNGSASTMLIKLDGKVVADVGQGQGIKLELLPNTTYHFAFKNTFWGPGFGLTKVNIMTTHKGHSTAFDIVTPIMVGNAPEIARISMATLKDKAKTFPFVEPLVGRTQLALAPTEFPARIQACLRGEKVAPCQSLLAELPPEFVPGEIGRHIAQLEQRRLEEQQRQAQLENSLPPEIRRDKYMVQLSRYLKEQNYRKALPLFPKLEALPVMVDASLKFFYGEALLKTNQPEQALKQLYQYVKEQGNRAPHYTQALEMINRAESAR